MPLSLGLNVKKPAPSAALKPAPRRRLGLLDDDSDPETDAAPSQNLPKNHDASTSLQITTFDADADVEDATIPVSQSTNQAPSKPQISPRKSRSPPRLPSKNHPPNDIAPTLSSTVTARRIQTAAESEDASIYDYDAHYETSSSAAQAASRRAASLKEAKERTPKYMNHMKAAATQRQRDYLRAEDKRLQREREEDPEGEQEAFVTGAYKARQEEVRKLEEDEREKERDEEKRRGEGGMGSFWRGVMDEDEKRRVELAEKREKGDGEVLEELDKEREVAEQARKLNEAGANIVMNEEGQVADKRQLLNAGLNVASKARGANAVAERDRTKTAEESEQRPAWDTKEKRDARKAMGERHARMMQHQMEEAKKRKAEEDASAVQKREMESKSRKTAVEISSAKERYLQRKREADERKKLGIED
ncbi:MAG: hypothetical protein Q9162_004943 [Coniocarpon cinnabarinum]